MTTVSTVDPIRVTYGLSEREYMRLAPIANAPGYATTQQGPVLELVLDDGTVFPHPGRAVLVDREVDPKTGTMTVKGYFPNPGNILRPGQYGKVRAALEVKTGALLVPQRAVTELQGGYRVAVVGADSKVEIRTVEPGERSRGSLGDREGAEARRRGHRDGPAVPEAGHHRQDQAVRARAGHFREPCGGALRPCPDSSSTGPSSPS